MSFCDVYHIHTHTSGSWVAICYWTWSTIATWLSSVKISFPCNEIWSHIGSYTIPRHSPHGSAFLKLMYPVIGGSETFTPWITPNGQRHHCFIDLPRLSLFEQTFHIKQPPLIQINYIHPKENMYSPNIPPKKQWNNIDHIAIKYLAYIVINKKETWTQTTRTKRTRTTVHIMVNDEKLTYNTNWAHLLQW